MEDASSFHPIACESCRNKKSKCDRELPICSQCTSSGVNCRYPPINKRGIPSGYLSYIEQRLLDTELVVFELLSAIYKSQVPIQPVRLSETERQALTEVSQKQPKSAKIEEWKSVPLTTDEHRNEWWLKRCESMSHPIHLGPNSLSQDAMTPQDTWLDASPLSVQYEDVQSHTAPPWQPPLDAMMPGITGTLDHNNRNDVCASLIDGTSEGASGVSSVASTATNPSNCLQPLSAERWRKYF